MIEVLATYLGMGYELSLLEVQKLLYFLQAAGDDLKLAYAKHTYGPYADNLRHVLKRFEGHYTQGLGEGSDAPDTDITLLPGAQEAAEQFLAAARAAGQDDAPLARVVQLIEGYESPYGMELLATVHWVAANEAANDLDSAVERIHAWNERKRRQMPREHIALAWDRLLELGWIAPPPAPLAEQSPITSETVQSDAAPGKYDSLSREQLIRLLQRRDAERQLGLVWERDEIDADAAVNDDFVALELDAALSHGDAPYDNLIIEGDNYDALRYLRMTHAGKVRCIYIDPPYNTGNRDFVYNDRFVDKTHRFRHSLWLEFMYRRLTLARDLLADDGVIFVSIDDNEMFRLGMLMDRVFGSDKFVAQFIWRKVDSPNDNKVAVTPDHEYLICYAARNDALRLVQMEAPDIVEAYGQRAEDGRRFRDRLLKKNGANSLRRDRPTMFFPIAGPDGVEVFPLHENGEEARWAKGRDAVAAHITDGTLVWKQREKLGGLVWEPYTREYAPSDPTRPWPTIWSDLPTMRQAKAFLRDVFQTADLFNTPKPVELIERVLRVVGDKDSVVLDFFAGSGTTAHAVAKLNAEDGGQRKFILVSSTEATDDQPDKNLCRDVCAERVRRVMAGYGNAKGEAVPGLGGNFAYLRARRLPRHRLARRLGHAEIWNALQLLHDYPLQPAHGSALKLRDERDSALAYLPEWRAASVSELAGWCKHHPGKTLVVYAWTPERLTGLPEQVEFRPIPESLRLRFGGARA
ncbi:MAG: DNA methyltransferase [Lysobacterales bacterium]